jgi:predicted alpha/beta-hydrolase family hydrolase
MPQIVVFEHSFGKAISQWKEDDGSFC